MRDIREVIQKQTWLSWGISHKLLLEQRSRLCKMFLTPSSPSLLILFATDFTRYVVNSTLILERRYIKTKRSALVNDSTSILNLHPVLQYV